MVTVRYDFGTTEKKKSTMLGFFSFNLNSSSNLKTKVHLDAKILIINTNTIRTLLYYV